MYSFCHPAERLSRVQGRFSESLCVTAGVGELIACSCCEQFLLKNLINRSRIEFILHYTLEDFCPIFQVFLLLKIFKKGNPSMTKVYH